MNKINAIQDADKKKAAKEKLSQNFDLDLQNPPLKDIKIKSVEIMETYLKDEIEGGEWENVHLLESFWYFYRKRDALNKNKTKQQLVIDTLKNVKAMSKDDVIQALQYENIGQVTTLKQILTQNKDLLKEVVKGIIADNYRWEYFFRLWNFKQSVKAVMKAEKIKIPNDKAIEALRYLQAHESENSVKLAKSIFKKKAGIITVDALLDQLVLQQAWELLPFIHDRQIISSDVIENIKFTDQQALDFLNAFPKWEDVQTEALEACYDIDQGPRLAWEAVQKREWLAVSSLQKGDFVDNDKLATQATTLGITEDKIYDILSEQTFQGDTKNQQIDARDLLKGTLKKMPNPPTDDQIRAKINAYRKSKRVKKGIFYGIAIIVVSYILLDIITKFIKAQKENDTANNTTAPQKTNLAKTTRKPSTPTPKRRKKVTFKNT